jgi:hypothetical protein
LFILTCFVNSVKELGIQISGLHFDVSCFSITSSGFSAIAEHKFLLKFFQELSGTVNVNKKSVDLSDILNVHLSGLSFLGNEVGGGDEMDGVTEGALFANLGQQLHGTLGHFDVFFLASDVEDLADLFV